jgi:hypothetical protein
MLLVCASLALAQKTPPAKPAAPKPSDQNVFVQSWDAGEIKFCSTYSHEESLLICDDKAFMSLAGDNAGAGMNTADAYTAALLFAMTHSKTFVVRFSKEPWPSSRLSIEPPDGLSLWKCSKDKTITCKFVGSDEKKP